MLIAICILSVLVLFIFFVLDKLVPALGHTPLGAMIGLFGIALFFIDAVLGVWYVVRLLMGL